MTEDPKEALLEKITTRSRFDELSGRLNYFYSQLLAWVAFVGSFGTSIVSATGKVSNLWVAILAAIPGSVIVIDRHFSFGRRARWHWDMVTELQELENALRFENAPIPEISRALTELRRNMEKKFPGILIEGLGEASRSSRKKNLTGHVTSDGPRAPKPRPEDAESN